MPNYGIDGLTIEQMCNEVYPLYSDPYPFRDGYGCMNGTKDFFDINGDDAINFREWVPLLSYLYGTHKITTMRWFTLNCSDCVGMDHYNPYLGQ